MSDLVKQGLHLETAIQTQLNDASQASSHIRIDPLAGNLTSKSTYELERAMFEGCTFLFVPSPPSLTQAMVDILKERTEERGGTVLPSLRHGVTHVIMTGQVPDPIICQKLKLHRFQKVNCIFVHPAWISASITQPHTSAPSNVGSPPPRFTSVNLPRMALHLAPFLVPGPHVISCLSALPTVMDPPSLTASPPLSQLSNSPGLTQPLTSPTVPSASTTSFSSTSHSPIHQSQSSPLTQSSFLTQSSKSFSQFQPVDYSSTSSRSFPPPSSQSLEPSSSPSPNDVHPYIARSRQVNSSSSMHSSSFSSSSFPLTSPHNFNLRRRPSRHDPLLPTPPSEFTKLSTCHLPSYQPSSADIACLSITSPKALSSHLLSASQDSTSSLVSPSADDPPPLQPLDGEPVNVDICFDSSNIVTTKTEKSTTSSSSSLSSSASFSLSASYITSLSAPPPLNVSVQTTALTKSTMCNDEILIPPSPPLSPPPTSPPHVPPPDVLIIPMPSSNPSSSSPVTTLPPSPRPRVNASSSSTLRIYNVPSHKRPFQSRMDKQLSAPPPSSSFSSSSTSSSSSSTEVLAIHTLRDLGSSPRTDQTYDGEHAIPAEWYTPQSPLIDKDASIDNQSQVPGPSLDKGPGVTQGSSENEGKNAVWKQSVSENESSSSWPHSLTSSPLLLNHGDSIDRPSSLREGDVKPRITYTEDGDIILDLLGTRPEAYLPQGTKVLPSRFDVLKSTLACQFGVGHLHKNRLTLPTTQSSPSISMNSHGSTTKELDKVIIKKENIAPMCLKQEIHAHPPTGPFPGTNALQGTDLIGKSDNRDNGEACCSAGLKKEMELLGAKDITMCTQGGLISGYEDDEVTLQKKIPQQHHPTLCSVNHADDHNKSVLLSQQDVIKSTFESENEAMRISNEAPGTVNLNAHLTEPLQRMQDLYRADRQEWRTYGYGKAIAILKRHPVKIEREEQIDALARDVRGFGKKTAAKCIEILQSGRLRRLEFMLEDPRLKALEDLSRVHGIGPASAAQLYAQGVRSVEDLKKLVVDEDTKADHGGCSDVELTGNDEGEITDQTVSSGSLLGQVRSRDSLKTYEEVTRMGKKMRLSDGGQGEQNSEGLSCAVIDGFTKESLERDQQFLFSAGSHVMAPLATSRQSQRGGHSDVSPGLHLTHVQRTGLKFVEDMGHRVPRAEMTAIIEHVKRCAQRVMPNAIVVCCGSYRRGKKDSGDCDILITHPSWTDPEQSQSDRIEALDRMLLQMQLDNIDPLSPNAPPVPFITGTLARPSAAGELPASPLRRMSAGLHSTMSDTKPSISPPVTDKMNVYSSTLSRTDTLPTSFSTSSPSSASRCPSLLSSQNEGYNSIEYKAQDIANGTGGDQSGNDDDDVSDIEFIDHELTDGEDGSQYKIKPKRSPRNEGSIGSFTADMVAVGQGTFRKGGRGRGVEEPSHNATWMGFCKLPKWHPQYSGYNRRVDLKFYAAPHFPFALLYFTGSDHFNRSMRYFAKVKGWTLSDTGLCKAIRRRGEKVYQSRSIFAKCERDIFEALGLIYVPPHQRNGYENFDANGQRTTVTHDL